MAKYKIHAKRLENADTMGFTKTVKFKVLHCGDIIANSNKFYCIELQKNPETGMYRIFTHYGRLNHTNTYNIRNCAIGKDGEIINFDEQNFSIVEKEYNKLLKKKLKGRGVQKEKTTDKYFEVSTFSPKVGSTNIQSQNKENKKKTKLTSISSFFKNKDVKRIINWFYEENIHAIKRLTTITFSDYGIETPLGPVTIEHIGSAYEKLKNIENLIQKGEKSHESQVLAQVNNQYYSMIPHPFGAKIPKNSFINNDEKLIEEYELLDQLKTAVQAGKKDNARSNLDALGIEIEPLTNKSEYNSIKEQFLSSRSQHHMEEYKNYKIKKIYTLKNNSVNEKFKQKGELMQPAYSLWHGSKNCNILSIIINGLIVPPYNAGHVTGRKFGNGIYAGSSSTKALNYATGCYNETTKYESKNKSFFMFLVNFGMGNIYDTYYETPQGPPKGYDSIWAHTKTEEHEGELLDDEFIVYNPGQAKVTHLIEIKKGS